MSNGCGSALWLPEGSVRAVIVLVMVIGVLGLAFYTLNNEIIMGLMGLLGVVLRDYFGMKQETK
jgi:uncharacterized membrane protein